MPRLILRYVLLFIITILTLRQSVPERIGDCTRGRNRGGNRGEITRGGASIQSALNTPLVASIKNGLASGLAAGCVKLALAPFDTIKTVQQFSRSDPTKDALTLVGAARELVKRGGVGELYSGVMVTVAGSMPSVGLYFGVYQWCKVRGAEALEGYYGRGGEGRGEVSAKLKTANIALAAAVGNTVASFSRVPYEVVKQKLQTGVYPGTVVALTTMWKTGGVKEFFPKGGVGIQMVRDIPYAIFTLMTYEYLQEKWVKKGIEEGGKPPAWKNMVAGAVAGGVGSLLTNPMDVVKTRIQTDPTIYNGIIDCAGRTLREEGIGAFGRGCGARLCHKIPANGLFFINYEFFRRVLGVEQGGERKK